MGARIKNKWEKYMENGTLHVARATFFVKMRFKIDQKFEKSVHGAFWMENGTQNGSRTFTAGNRPPPRDAIGIENWAPKVASGTSPLGLDNGTKNL